MHIDLALDFIVDGTFDKAERVDIFDFCARAELLLPFGADGNISVTTERTFLHIAVADFQVTHQGMDFFHVGDGFLGRTHIRFGDDFQQWRAGAVQIDTGLAVEILVQRFSGVFFQVSTGNTDALGCHRFPGRYRYSHRARSATRTG